MTCEYDERYQKYVNAIESYFHDYCFQYENEPQQLLFESMRYSLLAGGKRLRPVFVLEFCRMCGGDWRKAIPFAAAVEMIHTYSLIHDDLPCMDNDDYRRGRLTNHKVYGEAMAVLAGDALLTSAFSFLTKAEKIPAECRLRAVMTLSHCAGELGMVGGQVLDMLSESRECTSREVVDIQSRKTGALIKASCCLGVIAANGDETALSAAETFADHLGLAFQIRDDVLDVIGDASVLGKATNMDENKNTFVHIYGLDRCQELICQHTNMAVDSLKAFGDHAFLEELSRRLTDRMK